MLFLRVDFGLVEVTADKHDLGIALLLSLPVALRLTVEHHVHTLKNTALRVALERDDAFAAQDLGTLRLRQIIYPGHELVRIEVAVDLGRNRLHVLVVVVLQPVPMPVPVIMMIVVMVMLVDDEEVRLDIQNAIEIERAPFEHR